MDATGHSIVGEIGQEASEPALSPETPSAPVQEEPGAQQRSHEPVESEGAGAISGSAEPEEAGGDGREVEAPIDPAPLARDLLDQILQAMGVTARVEGQPQPDGAVRLLVEGPEMGVVIGKHGATINSMQYLLGLIVQKRTGERVRLIIDAEGYRSRREQALKDMARAYAQRVKETGNEAVLDALQSYERRIIHNCLADDPDVFTYSEGEEPDRRVVISPRLAEEG